MILVSVNDDGLKTELKKAVDNIKYGNRKSSVNSMELEDKIEDSGLSSLSAGPRKK